MQYKRRYSRWKADRLDKLVIDDWSGELQQHDVILVQVVWCEAIVRVNYDPGRFDVLTTVLV